MAVFNLTGQDVIKIDDRLMTDFADGEVAKLSYSADIVTVKAGKNGNTIYAKNEAGNQATLELRVLRGSSDDKWLNSRLLDYKNKGPEFILMTGNLVKLVGDGTGSVTKDTYLLTGGIFTKLVDVVSNVEGDTEQAISKYTMQYAFAPRAIS